MNQENLKKYYNVIEKLKFVLSSYLMIDIKSDSLKNWIKNNFTAFKEILPNILESNFSKKDIKGYESEYSILSIGEYIISSYKLDNDDLKYKNSFLLKSYANIPNLWVYKDLKEIKTAPQEDTDIAYYNFIIESISMISRRPVNDIMSDAKIFIKENINKIDNIKKLFSKVPEKLGSGMDGVAYSINNSMVLKIFRNEFAFDSAVSAINRLHNKYKTSGTEAMIYDVGKIGRFRGIDIYYYIIEKVIPIETGNKELGYPGDVYEIFYDNLDKLLDSIVMDISNFIYKNRLYNLWSENKEDHDILYKIINKLSNKIISDSKINYNKLISNIDSLAILSKNWFDLFIKEIFIKILSRREDLSLGNLGITQNKQLRFFDPAYSENNQYKLAAIKKYWKISKSKISGQGVFAQTNINPNTNIGLAFKIISNTGNPDHDIKRTRLGEKVNHSISPNLKFKIINNNIFFITKNKINLGEELTINYNKFPWEGKRIF